MAWTLNSVRIYVQGFSSDEEALVARLNPRAGGTILHWFGSSDEILQIQGFVLTDTDKDSLKALKDTNDVYELVSPEGSLGNWLVKKVSAVREMSNHHRFFDRPSEALDEPLYRVTLELYEDDSGL